MPVIKEFSPHPNLKKLYAIYAIGAFFGGIVWWAIPAGFIAWLFFPFAADASIWILASVVVFVVAPLAVIAYWIPAFYKSIKFVLEDDEIIVTKGVWWKVKAVVPYNRITNINVDQGPISRSFGLAKLSVQTAGFSMASGGGGRAAEATIFGIKNFEEIREFIMDMVRGFKPMAVEAAAELKRPKDINMDILEELRLIRKELKKR
jgi:membrane protein YdbS with pleckstrin-like domain